MDRALKFSATLAPRILCFRSARGWRARGCCVSRYLSSCQRAGEPNWQSVWNICTCANGGPNQHGGVAGFCVLAKHRQQWAALQEMQKHLSLQLNVSFSDTRIGSSRLFLFYGMARRRLTFIAILLGYAPQNPATPPNTTTHK